MVSAICLATFLAVAKYAAFCNVSCNHITFSSAGAANRCDISGRTDSTIRHPSKFAATLGEALQKVGKTQF